MFEDFLLLLFFAFRSFSRQQNWGIADSLHLQLNPLYIIHQNNNNNNNEKQKKKKMTPNSRQRKKISFPHSHTTTT